MPTWGLYGSVLIGVLIAVCGVSVARLYAAEEGARGDKVIATALLAAAIGLAITLISTVGIIAGLL